MLGLCYETEKMLLISSNSPANNKLKFIVKFKNRKELELV